MSTSLNQLEKQIVSLKEQLMALGPMRPGSLSKQFRDPKKKQKPFYQISYTHRMKSRSEYVRPEHLPSIRIETATFKRFKKLVDRLVTLSLKASQLRVRQKNPSI